MGRQLKVLTIPDDGDELAKLLKEKAFALFIDEDAAEELRFSSDLRVEKMGESNLRIFISSEKFLGNVKVRMSGRNKPVIDSLRSEVVEVNRCYFDGKLLRAGRFYYDPGFFDERGDWTEKSKEFLKWAERVFRLVRKALPIDRSIGVNVGQFAAEWMKRPGSTVSLN